MQLIIFFLLIVFLIIQSSSGEYILFNNVRPNFILVLIICFSLVSKRKEGIFVGFFGGLLEDIFCGTLYFFTIPYVITAMSISFLKEKIFRRKIFVIVSLVFLFSLFNEIFIIIESHPFNFFHKKINFKEIFLESLYNAFLSPIIFWGVFRLKKKFDEKKISYS